ncbi:unnamed protein product, partial [Closterium sp. NIES-64]
MASISPARLGATTSGSVGRILRSFALLVVLSCLIRVCYHQLIALSSPDAFYAFNSSTAGAVRYRPSRLPLEKLTDSCVTAINSLAHSPPNGDGPALTPPQELAAAAACRAELRNAPLQQWAAEAGWREAADVDYQVAVPPELPSPRAQLTWEALSPATSPATSRPTADSPITSAYVGRAVKRNVTSLARIEAGVDAVCRGVREIEARLSGDRLFFFCPHATRTRKLPHVAHSKKKLCVPPFPSPFTFSIAHALHSILPGAPGRR